MLEEFSFYIYIYLFYFLISNIIQEPSFYSQAIIAKFHKRMHLHNFKKNVVRNWNLCKNKTNCPYERFYSRCTGQFWPIISICTSLGFRALLVLMVSVGNGFRLQKSVFKFSLFGAFILFFRSLFYSSLFRISSCAHHCNHLNLVPKAKSACSLLNHYH